MAAFANPKCPSGDFMSRTRPMRPSSSAMSTLLRQHTKSILFSGYLCAFRGMAATDSDLTRPPAPIHRGHRFRRIAASLLGR